MSLTVIAFDFDPELRREFVELPMRLRPGEAEWLASERAKVEAQLSPSYPFFTHGLSRNFLVHDDAGVCRGRISAIVNHALDIPGASVGHVGFFEAEDDDEVAGTLLESACSFLRTQSIDRVWGPLNYSTLHSYRFLTSGFDKPPFYTDIYNPPYYPELFKRFGFHSLRTYSSELSSAHGVVAEQYRRAAQRLRSAGFTIRLADIDRFDEELELLYALVMDIFGGNFAFSPMSYEEFRRIYKPYHRHLQGEHLRFAFAPDGTPAGFVFAFPDFSGRYPEAFVGKMVGVKSAYKLSGLAQALMHEVLSYNAELGFESIIASLRIDGNPSTQFGAGTYRAFKTYELFELEL